MSAIPASRIVRETNFAGLTPSARGKVRDIYDLGDKLLIVGYDEQAEIVADWTDNAKAIEASLRDFRKKGQPHLFDALAAVADHALRPLAGQKRVIVVISDGLDKGSKTGFEQILAELQLLDITVYCVQAPDRTRGAIRRRALSSAVGPHLPVSVGQAAPHVHMARHTDPLLRPAAVQNLDRAGGAAPRAPA